MPGPGLVVRCGCESFPGLSGTDDAELQSSKWLRCARSVRYGYRKMKRCRSARHEEQRGMGNPVAWLPNRRSSSRIGIRLHRGTAEMDAALEEESPSVETQGENEYGRD